MKSSHQVVLYFQVHQPRSLNRINYSDIGKHAEIFNASYDREAIKHLADTCYKPANDMFRKLVDKGNVKVSFAISGVMIDQLEEYAPEVLVSFRDLAQSGGVEFLGETYYHSLTSLTPNNEFIRQVQDHTNRVKHYFGVTPTIFRNTGLIYSTSISSKVAQLGFKGMICEYCGDQHEAVYKHPTHRDFAILLQDNKSVIRLDYNNFSKGAGLIEQMIAKFRKDGVVMVTPSELVALNKPTEVVDISDFRDLSPWLGNEMQRDAFNTINNLEESVINSGDKELISTWRNLQSSDHFYDMGIKNPDRKDSPFQSFINYMNIVADFSQRVTNNQSTKPGENSEYERQHNEVPIWAQQYAAHVADTIG